MRRWICWVVACLAVGLFGCSIGNLFRKKKARGSDPRNDGYLVVGKFRANKLVVKVSIYPFCNKVPTKAAYEACKRRGDPKGTIIYVRTADLPTLPPQRANAQGEAVFTFPLAYFKIPNKKVQKLTIAINGRSWTYDYLALGFKLDSARRQIRERLAKQYFKELRRKRIEQQRKKKERRRKEREHRLAQIIKQRKQQLKIYIKNRDPRAYFPLSVASRTLMFRGSRTGNVLGRRRIRLLKSTSTVAVVYGVGRNHLGRVFLKSLTYYKLSRKGIYMARIKSQFMRFSDRYLIPPRPVLLGPIRKGTKWRWKDGALRRYCKIVAVGVSAPALRGAPLKGCVKVRFFSKVRGKRLSVGHEFFCPGMGKVFSRMKSVKTGQNLMETYLESFR